MSNWKNLNLEDNNNPSEKDENQFEIELNLDDNNEKLDTDTSGTIDSEEEEAQETTSSDESSEEEEKVEEENENEKVKRKRSRRRGRVERLAADNKRLQEENNRLQELQERLDALEKNSSTSQIDSRINTLNDTIIAKQAQYQKALSDEDHASAASINTEIGELLIDRKVLTAQKQDSGNKSIKPDQKPVTKQTEPTQKPEAYLDWSEENPWFEEPESRDERRLTRYIRKQAQDLLKDDPEALNDDEFYEELSEIAQKYVFDKKLEIEGFKIPEEKSRSPKKKTSPTESSSRDSGITKVGNKIRVNLSEEEQKVARRMNMSYEDYAKEKIKNQNRTKTGWISVF